MNCQKMSELASPIHKPLRQEMREMKDRSTGNVLSISSVLKVFSIFLSLKRASKSFIVLVEVTLRVSPTIPY